MNKLAPQNWSELFIKKFYGKDTNAMNLGLTVPALQKQKQAFLLSLYV